MLNQTGYTRQLRVMTTIAVSLSIVLALLILLQSSTMAVDSAHEPTTYLQGPAASAVTSAGCTDVTAVPERECLALVDLYSKTNGAGWTNQTNWLAFESGDAPCDWVGVTCSNNHITQLELARNQLSGTLPLSTGELTGLTHLRLEKNSLTGRIPPAVCGLETSLVDASFAYNGLFAKRYSVERCMQTIDADWLETQTTPVTDLRVTEFYTDRLRLAWTPIAYTADGGYYEIAIATKIDGPFIVHGQTADKSVATYLIDGLDPGRPYYIRVATYTPPHDDQPGAIRSTNARITAVTKTMAGRTLVIAYFPADNDLATEIGYVVERFRHGAALNPNVEVVMLVDGRKDGDTRLLKIAGGQVVTTNVVEQEWGVTELDTADPAVLAWFLQYAREQIPAERTVVALIGHGIPVAPEVTWAEPPALAAAPSRPAGKIPPLPKEHEFSPSDITDRGYMSTVDVGQALLAATDNGADPFDVVYFDQCFQGSLDVLYEVYNSAHVFVASPNYAWLVAAYDKYITQLSPSSTPVEMAQSITYLYEDSLDRRHPNSIFWVRGSDIPAIGAAISELGDALLAVTQASDVSRIAEAVRQSQYVDTTQCGRQNLQLGPPDELIGVETLAKNLRSEFSTNDAYGINVALDNLKTAMARVGKRALTGRPYIAPDEFWDYEDTITLLAPLPRNSPSNVAWRSSIYRSDAPFTATWTIDPAQPVTVTASLAYARDGRWDDFLAGWYSDLAPTVGAWCHYIPPQQLTVDETDPLTLTVTANGQDALQLSWTATDDTSAIEYWLQGKEPYDISWQVKEVIAIDQTSVAFAAPVPGVYRFAVLARSADNEFTATSDRATFELTVSEERRIYLPLLKR